MSKIISTLNAIFFLSAVALTGYLYFNTLRARQPFAFDKELYVKRPETENRQILSFLEKIPAFDENIFRQRRLFEFIPEQKPQAQEEGITLELLGLVSVGEKNAAMIRDIKENKDYYCFGGEIIGKFKIKQILEDRVIIEYEGKVMEINQ